MDDKMKFRETAAGKMLAKIFSAPEKLDAAVELSNHRKPAMAAYIEAIDAKLRENAELQDPALYDHYHGVIGAMIGDALKDRGYRWSQNPDDKGTVPYTNAEAFAKAMRESKGTWAIFDYIGTFGTQEQTEHSSESNTDMEPLKTAATGEVQNFFELIKKWMVRDFRTPNIPAEIIVDMLISEFIADIVKYRLHLKDAKLISKEFLLPRAGQEAIEANENLGATQKVRQHASTDFLVYDKQDTFYLVELKTTNSSLNSEQLLNMLWTCKQGMESLYHRYHDVIVNYCLGATVNGLQAKKSLYALQNMTDGNIDCSSFGMNRRQKDVRLKERQQAAAEKILSAVFKDECRNAKLKIFYVSLHDELTFGKIKEMVWPREKLDQAVNSVVNKLKKSGKYEHEITRIREFGSTLDENFITENIVDTPVLLKEFIEDESFADSLGAKKELWIQVKTVLGELLKPHENWFGADRNSQ